MAATATTLSSSSFMVSNPSLVHYQHHSSIGSLKSGSPVKIPSLSSTVNSPRATAPAAKAEFDIGIFKRDIEGSNDGSGTPELPGAGFPELEDKEEPPCPPGLRKYETMIVLRPDMSEDERLTLTQKYEELLVAGGGMYVEVFNRGVIPLAYGIKRKNKAGESNTYLDGIYLLFTYFTKPDSVSFLTEALLTDDNVIRSSSFKIRKRKLH